MEKPVDNLWITLIEHLFGERVFCGKSCGQVVENLWKTFGCFWLVLLVWLWITRGRFVVGCFGIDRALSLGRFRVGRFGIDRAR